MTEAQAHDILNRVRAGDKTPTLMQINTALILSGDITTSVSAQSIRGLRDKAAHSDDYRRCPRAFECERLAAFRTRLRSKRRLQ